MKESDFFNWRREMTTRFQEIQDSSDIYSLLKTETQNMEYDYFALCVRHPVPFTRPKLTLHTTYPEAWLEHYQAENYYVIDPVLKPANYLVGPLSWNDALFAGAAEELWNAARDHGLVKGVTHSASLRLTAPRDFYPSLEPARVDTPWRMTNWRCDFSIWWNKAWLP